MSSVKLTNNTVINTAQIAWITEPFTSEVADVTFRWFKIHFTGGATYEVHEHIKYKETYDCMCGTSMLVDENYNRLIVAL